MNGLWIACSIGLGIIAAWQTIRADACYRISLEFAKDRITRNREMGLALIEAGDAAGRGDYVGHAEALRRVADIATRGMPERGEP